AINENSGAGQVVYSVASTDATDYVSGSTSYSLGAAGGDEGAFSINPTSGAETLTANPNFEAKSSYHFEVIATDAAGNHSSLTVRPEERREGKEATTITSRSTSTEINKNND